MRSKTNELLPLRPAMVGGMKMDEVVENAAGDIFLERLRALINASSDGTLRIMTAIGCLEIIKHELYEQFAEEENG